MQTKPDATGGQVERGVSRPPPKRWNILTLKREAMRLSRTFDARTEAAEEIIDAAEVLRALVDWIDLYYLLPSAAHEASQGAYLQAAHLEWQANNNPEAHRRTDLIRRAHLAMMVAEKLQSLGPNAG